MIAVRCGLGILCAVICGLTYLIRTPGDICWRKPCRYNPAVEITVFHR